MSKPRTAVVLSAALAAVLLIAGCAGTPRLSVQESCSFLNQDTFKPEGNQQQQSTQIAKHYHEIAGKLPSEISEPIQQMAEIMDKAAASSLGATTSQQQQELAGHFKKIGEYCK